MLSSQVSTTLCTFAITSILIPVQGQLLGPIGEQIIEKLKLNSLNSSRLEQLLEETYQLESHQQIKAKLLKQIKDDLIQCQGLKETSISQAKTSKRPNYSVRFRFGRIRPIWRGSVVRPNRCHRTITNRTS